MLAVLLKRWLMQTIRRSAAVIATLLLTTKLALAFDGDLTAGEAFRMGFESYKAGDTETALEALNFAADHGHTAALWKLGRMYATGDGVQQNHSKAYEIFVRIANESADTNPRSRDARYAADALLSIGRYYERGIAGRLESDPGVARQFYGHAAAYFGNADAQFEIARMHHLGIGGGVNIRQAARWYKLSARKCHALAQAEFGMLLLQGEGISRNPVEGLMWLSLASRHAENNAGILNLHQQAFSNAPENDRQTAVAMADKRLECKNPK